MGKILKSKREKNKGFTLVELIVVLVILAILAAIMVPALLGYIDKARESQYILEANNIYKALQTINVEQYVNKKPHVSSNTFTDADVKMRIDQLIAPAEIIGFNHTLASSDGHGGEAGIGYFQGDDIESHPEWTTEQRHRYYTIWAIRYLEFKSSDGRTVTMSREYDNNWYVHSIE